MTVTNEELSRRLDKLEVEVSKAISTMQNNHEVVVDFLARMDTYRRFLHWFFGTPIGVAILWGIYKMGIPHEGLKP